MLVRGAPCEYAVGVYITAGAKTGQSTLPSALQNVTLRKACRTTNTSTGVETNGNWTQKSNSTLTFTVMVQYKQTVVHHMGKPPLLDQLAS